MLSTTPWARSDPKLDDEAWARGVELAAGEVRVLWDASFRRAVEETLGDAPASELETVLELLRGVLATMEGTDERIRALDPTSPGIKNSVVGPRIAPFVEAAFKRFDPRDRTDVAREVHAALTMLDTAGLAGAIPHRDVLHWTARALVESENEVDAYEASNDYDGYRNLRNVEQRVSITYALVDVAMTLLPGLTDGGADPAESLDRVRDLVGTLPDALREQVVRQDLDRIEKPTALLESWWDDIERSVEGQREEDAIRVIVLSKFFKLTMDEQALVRYLLELDLVARTLPRAEKQASALRRRIEALAKQSTSAAHRILDARAKRHWAKVLEPSSGE